MRSNILISRTLTVCLILMLLSCASRKHVTSLPERHLSAAERKEVFDRIRDRQPGFRTFSGRARSHLVLNGDSYDVTTVIRMESDRAIWMSLTALMGIEVGRVLITPDSVLVINRIRSEYTRMPFAFIDDLSGGAMDFSAVQYLLTGRVAERHRLPETEALAVGSGYRLHTGGNGAAMETTVDGDYRVVEVQIAEADSGSSLRLQYAEHRVVSGQPFPYAMTIRLHAGDLTLDAILRFNQVTFDQEISMPFTIPSTYTERQ